MGDDPNLRDGFAAELARAGHVVQTASDAGEGLVLLADAPDVVVLDLRMGSARGLEVARAAGRDGRAARVVVVAGSGDLTRSEVFALSPAVAALLRKPVDIETLVAEVEAAAQGDLQAIRALGRMSGSHSSG